MHHVLSVYIWFRCLPRLKIHALNVSVVLHGNSSLSSLLLHPFCCFYPVLSPHVPPQLPLLLHHPLSVALLFIAMSSQGSAATKAFSCCHYNYSLHTSTHTHVCTHSRSVFVSARVCTLACTVIHKKGWAIFTSRPPLHQPNLPPTHSFIPLCRQPHLLCWAQAVSVQSSSSIPPAHVSCSALRFFSSGISNIAFPPFSGCTGHASSFSSQGTSKVVAWDDLNTPSLASLVFVIRRFCLKGRLSQCCGRYLKLSVLSHPQRESWGRSSRWRFWRHQCSTTSQQVGHSVCVSMCACACAPPVRDFTINHILCDFACLVFPFIIVVFPFLFLCNGEMALENHSYGLRKLRSLCGSHQCFPINQTDAVMSFCKTFYLICF